MLRRWLDARGAIGRRSFMVDTTIVFLIGNLGFLAYFLATGPTSFSALGRMLDHPALALADMPPFWATVALTLWLTQVFVLAALSARRLHDMGQSGWLAGLSFVPGVQAPFWLALCLWPAKGRPDVQAA